MSSGFFENENATKLAIENTQIRVFVYFPLDHFPKSKIDSEIRFEMRMSIFIF